MRMRSTAKIVHNGAYGVAIPPITVFPGIRRLAEYEYSATSIFGRRIFGEKDALIQLQEVIQ
jgi:hypothetical protein